MVRAFATWAITSKKLMPSTIKSYISSLKVLHDLRNVKCENFHEDRSLKLLLKGAENTNVKRTPLRLAMNFHLLKVLCHRIAKTNWCEFSKQVIWTACNTSFFTSCRMGELLPDNSKFYDKRKTLKWENISFQDNKEILIFLPYTKTTGYKGAFIDIFPIAKCDYCPSAALKRLYNMSVNLDVYSKSKPVFSFKSGKLLDTMTLNKILVSLLPDFCDEQGKISCHSFRAAIPSAIASFPDKSKITEILEWGRWGSDAFKRYTRHERDRKKFLFEKIIQIL